MTMEELRDTAAKKVHFRKLSKFTSVAEVAASLLTDKGNVYTGVNIDTACGMGFCAEHSAIAQMVTNGETRIVRIVAVGPGGKVLPPCGRCREFIYQINKDNIDAEVMIEGNNTVKLRDLLPHLWS